MSLEMEGLPVLFARAGACGGNRPKQGQGRANNYKSVKSFMRRRHVLGLSLWINGAGDK